jgi:hypothetical protein
MGIPSRTDFLEGFAGDGTSTYHAISGIRNMSSSLAGYILATSVAVFLFVAPGGAPFDIEDVFWSHRVDPCTFDAMVEEFGLGTEPLLRLATIVRGADTRGRSFRQRLPVCLPRH